MKKLLLLLLLIVLLAAGCQKQTAADQQSADETPTDAYMITIPAEGWQQPAANIWVLVEETQMRTEVRLWVSRLADCSRAEAEEILQAAGYAPVELSAEDNGADMGSRQDGAVNMVRIVPAEPDVWLVYYSYPEAEAAVWEPVLAEIAASFTLN